MGDDTEDEYGKTWCGRAYEKASSSGAIFGGCCLPQSLLSAGSELASCRMLEHLLVDTSLRPSHPIEFLLHYHHLNWFATCLLTLPAAFTQGNSRKRIVPVPSTGLATSTISDPSAAIPATPSYRLLAFPCLRFVSAPPGPFSRIIWVSIPLRLPISLPPTLKNRDFSSQPPPVSRTMPFSTSEPRAV